jgi:hypothetical protein
MAQYAIEIRIPGFAEYIYQLDGSAVREMA